MGLALRPYQEQAVEAVFDEWSQGRDRTLVCQATGTGKTVVFATVAGRLAAQGKRTLVIAHRGELLDQAEAKIKSVTGLACAREQAESTSVGTFNAVTVGSVQTLSRDSRLAKFAQDRFDAIVIDEAHHALSDSYKKVLDHFRRAKVLGVTATADRADRRDLSEVFDSIAYEYGLAKAVKDGYLAPIKALSVPLDIDISEVDVQSGDFAAGQLGDALAPYLDSIASYIAENFSDRKTVIFLPLVRTAQAMRDKLLEKGIAAAEVDGDSPDRDQVLLDFAQDRYTVLCNSMLLTEGWDCPSVDCVCVLRPTKSRPLYAQMVGRGTRLCPERGKDHLLVLDFLWQTERMDLCRPASLLNVDQDISSRMQKKLEDAPLEAQDLMEAQDEAEEDAARDREAALAEKLAACRKKKARLVDPLQFEISICDLDLSTYEPSFAWEAEEATQAQAQTLEKFGINPDGMCKGKAKATIDKLIQRSQAGMATPKQVRQLERHGFLHPGTWTFDQANKVMGILAANRWRVPVWINPPTYDPNAIADTPINDMGMVVINHG